MYELNYDEAEYCKLSNDAFYNILYDEDMLDEANYREVEELQAKYPYGFEIDNDSWDELSGNDCGFIECTIIPYKNCDYAYTHEAKLLGDWVLLIAPNQDWSSVHVKMFNELTGETLNEKDVTPIENRYGNVQINYGSECKSGVVSCVYMKHVKPR